MRVWTKGSGCRVSVLQTQKAHVETFNGINVTWKHKKEFQLQPFCIRRWAFEDATSFAVCGHCEDAFSVCVAEELRWESRDFLAIFWCRDEGTVGPADSLLGQGYLLLERENQPESANTKGQSHIRTFTHTHAKTHAHTDEHEHAYVRASHPCRTTHLHTQHQEFK